MLQQTSIAKKTWNKVVGNPFSKLFSDYSRNMMLKNVIKMIIGDRWQKADPKEKLV